MDEAHSQGATSNERLLAAVKVDNEQLLEEVLSRPQGLDVNFQDGLGMSALHYGAQCSSFSCVELLLEEEVDVDLKNRLQGDTPLHLAVGIQDARERLEMVRLLVEAGADPRVKNKHGDKPVFLLRAVPENQETADILKKAELGLTMGSSAMDNDVQDEADDSDDPSD